MGKVPRPLFLAAGQGNGHGYSTKPRRDLPLVADEKHVVERIRDAANINDEPEAIGPAIVDGYASIANFHRTQQHAKDVAAMERVRPLLDVEDRMRDIHRRAKHSHVDLSHELHIMTRDLERARGKGKPAPPRTLDRIERIEGLLDGLPL